MLRLDLFYSSGWLSRSSFNQHIHSWARLSNVYIESNFFNLYSWWLTERKIPNEGHFITSFSTE